MMLYEAVNALLFHQQERRRILRLFITHRLIRKGEQRMSTPRTDDKILLFPQTATNRWIEAYARAELSGKNEATIDAYLRILRQLTVWVAQFPGSEGQFHPKFLTKTVFGDYVEELKEQEYSTSHQERVKTVVNGFANWLIAEGEIRTNPTRGITIAPQALLAPRELSKDQRLVLRNLVERSGDLRGAAMFALGYWAGCRVSDVSYLLMKYAQVGRKIGKLHVGHKGEKYRDISLLNTAREPLYEYLQKGKRTRESHYVFTSQRETIPIQAGELDGWRLGEAAIHEWFKQLKASATEAEASFIRDVTFHDLRHDFAHRANTTLLVSCYDRKMKTITLPKGSPDPLPELAAYLEPFVPLFRRSTSRRSLERYATGLLSDLPRKNCEAIAQAVASTSLEQLQHLLTDAAWDPLALDEARVHLLVKRSPANGVLVLDDTGLPKQGKASVGVQHQYSGTLGKQGNCQIVVSAEYVVDEPSTSQPLHWPLSARLYLPEVWAADRERCRDARVPEAVTFTSKPELALQLVDRAQAWGVPFATVVTDAGYGIPSFLRALDERKLPYVCAVACDFGVRLLHEMQQAEAEQAEPAPRKRGQPKKARPAPRHDAQEITEAQPESAWQTVEWREGSRGALRKQFVAIRVHAGTGCARHSETHGRSWTGPEGWLLGERPVPGEEGEPKWFFSCLPADTPLSRLVGLAHLRWPVEQFYEDSKGECGFDHFQGRSWDGLHHHLALVMLAYTFLMLQSLGQEVQTDPVPGAAFPPCSAAQPPGLPSAGADPALPGCCLMAY